MPHAGSDDINRIWGSELLGIMSPLYYPMETAVRHTTVGWKRFRGTGSVKFTSLGPTWRLVGSYEWDYKSPNIDYNYAYPTYMLYLQLPVNLPF